IIAHAQDLIVEKQNHLFAVSCGLSKGPVVTGNIGSPEHLDYTVVGEAVNLAARLCGCSGPISIIVTD
ncbi:MAG: guanylate cyclase, partial [Gammaproteobacteria bacterium]|nr:guanylate cyclase [candidate division Zixibacteria bacterium]NIR95570.1 guanylate cyclase [Gammaproteobacteria bacterium]NIR66263.1 guanylate cyclase [candidate division Zixibacteria bacterium]NIS45411.1 guanylate cyclase [candidate division Zixibacteria bacterium]NIU15960.1 guanylate cyclase [candidate division Zixibacteria bacterium]